MTILQKIGDCERPKDWCTSQDLLTQLESFCRAIYGDKSGIAELNQRRNLQMNGSTLLRRNNVLSIILRLVTIGYLKVISSKSFLCNSSYFSNHKRKNTPKTRSFLLLY